MVLSNYKCIHIRIQDPEILIQGLQTYSSNVSSNRIKIHAILLILQLETDYFSKLFISEMLHSKQWHSRTAILHEEVLQDSSAPIPAPIPAPMLHVHITLQSREFSIQNPILHAEDKELFEYYITYSRNSTHRRQGDLLEMHPCVLQDLPMTFQAFSRKSLQRQLQLLQLLQRHSGHSSHS